MKNFTKGFFAGSLMGGAIGILLDPSVSMKMKRLRKKTGKAIKSMGEAMEDFVASR